MKMPRVVIAAALFVLAASVVRADPKTELSEAIASLGAQSGYAWTSTPATEGSKSAARQGAVEGKTEKGGSTRIKSSSGDTAYEVGFKGEKIVVNYNGDWLSTAEIGENVSAVQRLKAFKKPVEEAGELLKKTGSLKKESDGLYAGTLEPEAARDLFRLLGRRAALAEEAKGSVKYWVKDGRLSKYEFVVEGRITSGEEKKEVDLRRTTTVEIQEVGATKVIFPDEAKKKLS